MCADSFHAQTTQKGGHGDTHRPLPGTEPTAEFGPPCVLERLPQTVRLCQMVAVGWIPPTAEARGLGCARRLLERPHVCVLIGNLPGVGAHGYGVLLLRDGSLIVPARRASPRRVLLGCTAGQHIPCTAKTSAQCRLPGAE